MQLLGAQERPVTSLLYTGESPDTHLHLSSENRSLGACEDAQAAAASAFLLDMVAAAARCLCAGNAVQAAPARHTVPESGPQGTAPDASQTDAHAGTVNGAAASRSAPAGLAPNGADGPGANPHDCTGLHDLEGLSDAALLASTAASLADVAERLAARARDREGVWTGHYNSGGTPSADAGAKRLALVYSAVVAAGAALAESSACETHGPPDPDEGSNKPFNGSIRWASPSPGSAPAGDDGDDWGDGDCGGGRSGFQTAEGRDPGAGSTGSAVPPDGSEGREGAARGAAGGAGLPDGDGDLLAARERCLQVPHFYWSTHT